MDLETRRRRKLRRTVNIGCTCKACVDGRLEALPPIMSIEQAASALKMTLAEVRESIADGFLPAAEGVEGVDTAKMLAMWDEQERERKAHVALRKVRELRPASGLSLSDG